MYYFVLCLTAVSAGYSWTCCHQGQPGFKERRITLFLSMGAITNTAMFNFSQNGKKNHISLQSGISQENSHHMYYGKKTFTIQNWLPWMWKKSNCDRFESQRSETQPLMTGAWPTRPMEMSQPLDGEEPPPSFSLTYLCLSKQLMPKFSFWADKEPWQITQRVTREEFRVHVLSIFRIGGIYSCWLPVSQRDLGWR